MKKHIQRNEMQLQGFCCAGRFTCINAKHCENIVANRDGKVICDMYEDKNKVKVKK